MKKPSLVADITVVFFAFAVTSFSFFYAYIMPKDFSRVVISGMETKWEFPLNAEETVEVPGPLGNTIIKIQDNKVWVEESPCANQLCVAQGRIQKNGGWAACLPNGVFFVLEGKNKSIDKIDAMAW